MQRGFIILSPIVTEAASKQKTGHAQEGKTPPHFTTEKVRDFKRAGLSLQGWGRFSRSLTTLADRKSGPVTSIQRRTSEQDLATALHPACSACPTAWNVPGARGATSHDPSKGLKHSGQSVTQEPTGR